MSMPSLYPVPVFPQRTRSAIGPTKDNNSIIMPSSLEGIESHGGRNEENSQPQLRGSAWLCKNRTVTASKAVKVRVARQPEKRIRSWTDRIFGKVIILVFFVVESLILMTQTGKIPSRKMLLSATPNSDNNSTLKTGISNNIIFGVTVAPHQYSLMDEWRSTCAKKYEKHGVEWRFMIGRPYELGHDLSGHDQGAQDTPLEKVIGRKILEEAEEHGDVILLPMRDQNSALQDKIFSTLEYFWIHQPHFSYIGKHDVGYCLDLDVIQEVKNKFETSMQCPESFSVEECPTDTYHELYASNYSNKRTIDDKVTPYAIGQAKHSFGFASFLSRSLVGVIVVQSRTRSVLNGHYGLVSEEEFLQSWVAYAKETNGIRTYFDRQNMMGEVLLIDEKILKPNDGGNTSVSCGDHHASSCSECPQGNGEAWCNDDCAWCVNQCLPREQHSRSCL